MIELVPDEKCTGCMLCVENCPQRAIFVRTDSRGFEQPYINMVRCVECGICQSVCPQLSVKHDRAMELKFPDAYLAWAKKEKIRGKGSSGGAFGVLAQYILEKGGTVVGAAYRNDFSVAHVIVESMEELKKLNGSKYVQSDTKGIWKKVKDLLKQGKMVLFSGTPCQVDALHQLLGERPDNLYTVDIICHGVPSPGVWQEYLAYLEKTWDSKVKAVNFRKKDEFGWTQSKISVSFEDGRTYLSSMGEDIYTRLFLQNVILRRSCYQCDYAKIHRISDITLGDFWALREEKLEDKEQGLSLVLINTKQGQELLDRVRSKLFMKSYPLNIAARDNSPLHHPPVESLQSKSFWENYKQAGLEYGITCFLLNTDRNEQLNCNLSVFKRLILMQTNDLNLSDILNQLGIDQIYLYGIGDIGKYLFRTLKDAIEIVAIIDVQAEKFRGKVDGIEVFCPQEIPKNTIPILVSPASRHQEILYHLVKQGVNEKRILSLDGLLDYGMAYLQKGVLPGKRWSYEKGEYDGI